MLQRSCHIELLLLLFFHGGLVHVHVLTFPHDGDLRTEKTRDTGALSNAHRQRLLPLRLPYKIRRSIELCPLHSRTPFEHKSLSFQVEVIA